MGANKLDNTTDYTTTGNKTNNVFTNQVNKVIVWVRNALHIPSSSQQRWVPLSTVKVSDGDEGDEDEECVEDSGASPDRGRSKVKPHYITIGLVLFSMLLLFIASTFYIKSLQGGNVDWLHKNIRIIAKFLIISIVLYYIGFFIFFSCYRRFKKVIWFPLLLVIGIVLWFAVWGKDIDYTLEKHGLYNMMILGAVEFMLVLYTLWWLLSIRILGLRKAIIFQLVLLNLIFLISIIRNVYFKAEWKKGVLGRELQNNGRGCDIPTNYVPYEAYLPEGYTNILGQKCPASRHFATLGSDNILTINCDSGQARYIEYPDYLEGTDYRINFALPPSVYWNYSAPVVTYAETVQAECGEDRQLFVRNIVKPSLLEEVKLETNNSTKNNDTIEQLNHPPNIMFLFIDALSRAHTHRRMYRTLDAFTDLVESGVMDMYEFFKYHAFASHTGPNTVPMFTGAQIYSEYSPTLDYPFYNSTDGFSYAGHELWWNKFDSKFVKSWVYGSCENWMDGYIHNNTAPFGLDHISVMPFCNSQCYPLPNPFGPMQGPFGAKARCVNDKHVHEYMLEYTEDYFSNYKDVAKIVQLSFLEAHEGTLEVITQLDRDFPAFFKSEAVHSELNNTFIILTADHGNHMSPFYVWTPNGKLENKLPALFILTPKWFSKRYPELANNLSNNQQRLVTPLDVYNTLMQLHDLPEFKQNSKSEIKDVNAMKGIFGEISEDRGCYEAFISPEECVCKN